VTHFFKTAGKTTNHNKTGSLQLRTTAHYILHYNLWLDLQLAGCEERKLETIFWAAS
jgi:hypothetical protein